MMDEAGMLIMMAVKVVDDVLFGGEQHIVEYKIEKIQASYIWLGTACYGPDTFLFHGVQISQKGYFSIHMNGGRKIKCT